MSWGLIGCGDIALRRVAPALTDLETCDFLAVSRKKAELLAILTVTHTVQEPKDTFMIYGTKGSIHIESLNQGDLTVFTLEGKRQESLPPHENIHQPLIEDFTDAVLNSREPVVTGEIGIAVTKVIDGIYGGSEK